ncbi:MAG: CDP-glycerol glycerophosphotransferase family protein, partial [Promethearchaeota archaeon]
MNLQLEKFSFLKNSNYYKFTRDIIVPFGLKIISRLFRSKIDEDLIIMGAYGGNFYLGNTRTLFEFLNKHSNYRVVWITKSNNLVKKIRNKGFNAIHSLNINAIRLLRKAKFVFITHGIYDLLPIEISPGTTIIQTWHGTPIKKIVLDETINYVFKKWGNILKLKLRYDQYIDFVLTPTVGDLEHKNLSSAFSIPLNKILNLGYPRLDILFNKDKEFVNSLKKKFEISEDFNRIILYCPTFRDFRTSGFKISNRDLKNLDVMLKETNSLFLMKGHLFGKLANHQGHVNIRNISNGVNIQELYLISDILITDYSSTMVDFSLLDKPILLFPYDLEEYIEKRGLYYNLNDIAPGPLLFTINEIIEALRNIDEIEKIYAEK